MRRVRIINKTSSLSTTETHVYDVESGEEIEFLTRIELVLEAGEIANGIMYIGEFVEIEELEFSADVEVITPKKVVHPPTPDEEGFIKI